MSRGNQIALPSASVLDWSKGLRDVLNSNVNALQSHQDATNLENDRKFHRDNIIEDRKLKEEQRLAKENTNKYLAGFHEKDFVFQLGDHGKYISGLLSDAQTRLDDEVSAVTSFITDPSIPIDQVAEIYKGNIIASGVKGETVDNEVAKFKTNLNAIRREFTTENYNQEAYEGRLKEIIDTKYGARRQDLANAISTGQGMTKEEKVNAIISRLPENLRNNMDLEFLRKQIGHKVTALSTEQLRKDETDRVNLLNQASIQNLQTSAKGSRASSGGSSGGKSSGKDRYGSSAYVAAQNKVQDTMNRPQLTIDAIGKNDYDKVLNEMRNLENQLIDKDIAEYALRSVIHEGWVDNSLEDKDIVAATALAHNLQMARNGTGEVRGSSSTGKPSDGSYTPVTPRSPQELKASLLRTPSRSTYLPALEKYLPKPAVGTTTNPPADLATSTDMLDDLLVEGEGSKNSNVGPKPDGSADFPVIRDDSFLDTPKTLGAEARAEFEKAARITRFKEGVDMVNAYNNSVGEKDITSDTVFVLPYDAEGNDKSWDEIVKDINSRESIGYLDRILSKRTIESARHNPALQKELIDQANKAISAGMRVSLGGSRVWDVMDKSVSGLRDLFSDVFIGSDDPTSQEYKQELADRKAEIQGWKDGVIGRDVLEDFIHAKMGTKESKTGLFGDLLDYATDTTTGNMASLVVPGAGAAGAALKGAFRGSKHVYKTMKASKNKVRADEKVVKQAEKTLSKEKKASKNKSGLFKNSGVRKAEKELNAAKSELQKSRGVLDRVEKTFNKKKAKHDKAKTKKTAPDRDKTLTPQSPKKPHKSTAKIRGLKSSGRNHLVNRREFTRPSADRVELTPAEQVIRNAVRKANRDTRSGYRDALLKKIAKDNKAKRAAEQAEVEAAQEALKRSREFREWLLSSGNKIARAQGTLKPRIKVDSKNRPILPLP